MTAKIIKICDTQSQNIITEAIQLAVKSLEKGRLVVFPTETVYGIAVSVQHRDSLQAIFRTKQRPENKPLTLHIADKKQLDTYVPSLSLLDRVFLRKVWPGPLTAVIKLSPQQMVMVRKTLGEELVQLLYHNNCIGMRLPDNPIARRILESTKAPVVATSANISGQAAAVSIEQLFQQQLNAGSNWVDENIDVIIDDGPTRYQKGSTVIKLDSSHSFDCCKSADCHEGVGRHNPCGFTVLRNGVLDTGVLERMRMVTILFVCTGNTCRSPMAEGIFRDMLAKKTGCPVDLLTSNGYKVLSAGVMAYNSAPPTPEAVAVCKEMGVDISSHKAKLLHAEMINQADIIFVMSRMHYNALLQMVPQAKARTFMLGGDRDIADPIGEDIDGYRRCANEIVNYLREQMTKMFPCN